ncbi:MAG: hypothetical protein ACRDBP_03635 [Luteolibacter sp.]
MKFLALANHRRLVRDFSCGLSQAIGGLGGSVKVQRGFPSAQPASLSDITGKAPF